MNLANLGKAGLLVAQNRLQTAGHNINNAATPGYNRQSVLVQTAGATATSAGWIGRGVVAVSVQRSYDNFLYQQLSDSQTKSAALTSYGDQISQINNLVADRTVGISPAIQKFFDSLDAVASSPADVAARQDLIGQANSLASQVRDANAFLDSQRQNINTQITTTVSQINSYLTRIQGLNKQITVAKASTPNQPPNDLLDQRDQLVSELGQLVNVKVYNQDDQVSITVGNGQTVLGGNTVYPLQAQPSAADPSRLSISYTTTDTSGQPKAVEMSDSMITGGKLGGLLTFRSDALDSVQNDLGRVALGISVAINDQHAKGYDMAGAPGTDLFSVGTPKVIDNAGNSATAGAPAASYTPGKLSQITSQDYRVQYAGPGATDYTVTRLPDGTAVSATVSGTTLSFDGVTLNTAGMAPAAGDSWLVQPTRDAAAGMNVLISAPDKIAAAGETAAGSGVGAGPANGDNALALAALRTAKVLANGSMGMNEAYSQLVNNVAVKAGQNTTAQKAQDTLVQQNTAAQQAVSGVNLDEEYINLQQYQEQYQAAARLISTASTLFDTLLSLRG
ncbi:MAG: flagellar hook-associated protein FlgK [Castellaniella sp.]|uniref:flagellar hook-associated protein FlgK n=1 Tax=Castellaniella sp. TaxID=1955812 RepID=UPI001211650F|nr:flagellar hook-associated protein FlgK [Castellaniella sp.]TAN27718.1 MAG: flagellar hook-associated protein FlgK [Castellaniella sp.]